MPLLQQQDKNHRSTNLKTYLNSKEKSPQIPKERVLKNTSQVLIKITNSQFLVYILYIDSKFNLNFIKNKKALNSGRKKERKGIKRASLLFYLKSFFDVFSPLA